MTIFLASVLGISFGMSSQPYNTQQKPSNSVRPATNPPTPPPKSQIFSATKTVMKAPVNQFQKERKIELEQQLTVGVVVALDLI